MASVTARFTGFFKLNEVKSGEVLGIYFTKHFGGIEKLATNQIMPLGPSRLNLNDLQNMLPIRLLS
jgi:hypothetical protein